MKRRLQQLLLTCAFGVLLILTVATVASFWRGYGVNVTRIAPTSTHSTKTESSFYYGRGGLYVRHERNTSLGDFSWFKPKSPDIRFFANEPRYPDNDWIGFGQTYFFNEGSLGTRHEVGVIAPFWILPPLLTVALALWFRRHRRKLMIGRCRVCGYDMRASPDRCPECGTPVARAAASSG